MKFNTIIDNQSLEMEFSDSLNQFSIKTENDMGIDCVKLSHNLDKEIKKRKLK